LKKIYAGVPDDDSDGDSGGATAKKTAHTPDAWRNPAQVLRRTISRGTVDYTGENRDLGQTPL
jgi:hypothetical protein